MPFLAFAKNFFSFSSCVPFGLLTCDTAVGGHHHRLDPWVLDDILPMDCVRMAQELVLVNINTSI